MPRKGVQMGLLFRSFSFFLPDEPIAHQRCVNRACFQYGRSEQQGLLKQTVEPTWNRNARSNSDLKLQPMLSPNCRGARNGRPVAAAFCQFKVRILMRGCPRVTGGARVPGTYLRREGTPQLAFEVAAWRTLSSGARVGVGRLRGTA